MAYKMIAGFGFEEEWGKFIQRHPLFFDKLPLLDNTCAKIFIRNENLKGPADQVVFFQGITAVEEFNEILFLCANGYGIGGLKLLRGMFERVVSALYISAHREEAKKFIDFQKINQRKYINHLKESGRNISGMFLRKILDEIESDYQCVKSQFTETCKKCGITRPQPSWTKLDLASMAREVGLAEWYSDYYFYPTLQIHSTLQAWLARMKLSHDRELTFRGGTQYDKALLALMSAHNCLLAILVCQDKHFNLGLQEEIQSRGSEFFECWQVNG